MFSSEISDLTSQAWLSRFTVPGMVSLLWTLSPIKQLLVIDKTSGHDCTFREILPYWPLLWFIGIIAYVALLSVPPPQQFAKHLPVPWKLVYGEEPCWWDQTWVLRFRKGSVAYSLSPASPGSRSLDVSISHSNHRNAESKENVGGRGAALERRPAE